MLSWLVYSTPKLPMSLTHDVIFWAKGKPSKVGSEITIFILIINHSFLHSQECLL